jgi:D-alanyl-D-alanine-carboxypeptidase/D-alanyl-D-alanine-endopeptidase
MKFKLLLFAFIFSYIIPQAQSIKRINGSTISGDSLTMRVQHLMQIANVSGVAISVFNNNEPVYSKTFGLADVQQHIQLLPNTEMYGASFSKMVFAYIVMQLVQDKIIDLDKPLVTYLPKSLPDYKFDSKYKGYQDLKDDERYKKITARMCLMHTTGFPNWRWFEPDQKLKIKSDPGTRYSYSGEGIYLLQFVLEQITGENLETIAQERVFQPLGMKNTSYVWQNSFDTNICYGHNEKGEPYELKKRNEANAAGSMTTTLNDFTKFYTALINHKNLTKKSFDEMTSTQVRIKSKAQFGPRAIIDSADNDNIQLSYGLGVGVFHTPYGRAFFKEGHDDGWGHYSICYPDKKIAIVIMTNNDNGESIFKELLEYAIGDIYTPWRWENYIPYDKKN